MKKEAIDQIIGMIFSDEVKDGFVGEWGAKGESVDFIPEMLEEGLENPPFTLEDVNSVFYVLYKAGVFEPMDYWKGNWWTTPLYWIIFDEYHSLKNKIEKDKDEKR